MDNNFVSASLGVKIADLKRVETQIMQLENKNNQEMIEFLNHLQIGGDAEVNSFDDIISAISRKTFEEIYNLLDREDARELDLVFADEILTMLNLRVNNVRYLEKFGRYDYLHISLKNLLENDEVQVNDRYLKLVEEVNQLELVDSRKKEAQLVKKYYEGLLNSFPEHTYLLAKVNAINTRTLYRAKRLSMSESEIEDEIIGDTNTIEKFLSLYRLDQNQIAASLRDKVESKLADLFSAMMEDKKNADFHFDVYLDDKVNDMVFEDDVIDLLIVYVAISKRISKYLKKVFYRVHNV